MKRILAMLLSALLLLGLAACGGSPNGTESGTAQTQPNTAPADPAPAETGPAATDAPGDQPPAVPLEPARTPGKLYYITLGEGEQPVLLGVRLEGNQASNDPWAVEKPAAENIRCIFMLNEWVDFYLNCTKPEGMRVWVLKHRNDQSFYETAVLSDETPGYVLDCELRMEPDAEAGASWGSFYLHPEEAEPGDYDMVFTCDGAVVATLLTHFYGEYTLTDKSDAELLALVQSLSPSSAK